MSHIKKIPGLKRFLNGFGIKDGLQVGGFVLEEVHGSEIPIIHDREYQYPIEMVFTPRIQGYPNKCDANELLDELEDLTHNSRIIKSSYGNPYECIFGTPQIKQISNSCSIIITTLGHSHRVFYS